MGRLKGRQKSYTYDHTVFRRQVLPAVLIIMTPSLIIDMVLFYRVLSRHAAIYDASGRLMVVDLLLMLLLNAAMLKLPGFIVYFLRRFVAKRSSLHVRDGTITYVVRKIDWQEIYLDGFSFHAYVLHTITQATLRRSGALHIDGDLEKQILREDRSIRANKKVRRCRIPAWFSEPCLEVGTVQSVLDQRI